MDHILLTPYGKDQIKKPLTVLEISPDYMVIKAEKKAFDESCTWDIELHEMTSFDTYIAILERMEEAQEKAVYYLFIYINKSIMNNIYRLFHDWTDIMTKVLEVYDE